MRILYLVLSAFIFFCSNAAAQVPEIPNTNLGDIAMVTLDNFGNPVIIYNPIICQQIGPYLCEFYKAHEYGHVNLGHAYTGQHPAVREAEADCWAAQNAPIPAVQAAIQWFSSGGGTSWHHGTGLQRAQRVIQCSQGR